jgi:nicotinamidase/pyrazinamidase
MADALIVVDMQNLFVDAVGERGADVLAGVNKEVADAVDRGQPVFYTRDFAPVELPDGDEEGRTELHPDLDVRGTVVLKGPGKRGGFSAFLHAPVLEPNQPHGGGGLGRLAGLLRSAGAESVRVVGIAADVCVAATARDAVRLGYPATIPLRATAFVHTHPDGDEAAVAELRADGVRVV